jgi:hypothetical protein
MSAAQCGHRWGCRQLDSRQAREWVASSLIVPLASPVFELACLCSRSGT